MNQKERTVNNIQAHIDVLLDDEMRSHACASKEHDLDFQVFRILVGYRLALDQIKALTTPKPEASDRDLEDAKRVCEAIDYDDVDDFSGRVRTIYDDSAKVIASIKATIRADERRKTAYRFCKNCKYFENCAGEASNCVDRATILDESTGKIPKESKDA